MKLFRQRQPEPTYHAETFADYCERHPQARFWADTSQFVVVNDTTDEVQSGFALRHEAEQHAEWLNTRA